MTRGQTMRFIRPVLKWSEHVLAAFGVIFIAYYLLFDFSVMVSDSMAPTLCGTSVSNGDRVLTEKLTLHFRRPHRWEVVTFISGDGIQVMKRVVGLPGETVSLRDGVLLVEGVPAERPASLRGIRYLAYGNLASGRAVQCGDGYYVLGDESGDSFDSRFDGPIAPRQFIGRTWLILWPLSRVGFVNP